MAVSAATVAIGASPAAADLALGPSIESESVANVTSTGATLEATINPESSQHWDHAQFQLVKNTSEYLSTFACPPEWARSSLCIGTDREAEGLPMRYVSAGSQGQTVNLGVALQPNTTYHWRIITARGVVTEDTFGYEEPIVYGPDQTFTTPSGSPGPPTIVSESTSHVSPTDATLNATINPGGLATSYEITVGTVGCVEEGGPANDCESTQVLGTLPGDSSNHIVSVDVAEAWRKLTPNTSYVFWARASNSAGKAYGAFHVFKTTTIPPPVIESESASQLISTDAVLEAAINDQGLEATYEFHLITAPPCLTAPQPCERPQYLFSTPAGKLLGSPVGQSVSVDLNSAGITLSPGERYEYWVSAASTAGTTDGSDQVLIAPKELVTPASAVTSSIGTPPGGPLTPPSLQQTGSGNGAGGTVLESSSGGTGSTGTHGHPARTSKVCKHKLHKHHASCLKHKRGKTASPAKKH
jgi:hypothetical protein